MWGKSKSGADKSSGTEVDTLIGEHTRVEGDIIFSGGLHVDGHVKGNVNTSQGGDSVLSISEVGCIEGEVNVASVLVNGTVKGNVHAMERIELGPKARVTGNVHYRLIEMAMGAEVNGNLVHSAEKENQVVSLKGEGKKKGKSGSV
ncbi:MAG TPA: polymer-forming cytoskeletal family protein [Gammaproteobacteria bacterium]|nr:polymer-forming cytoskeletal family protein [Gammaproteobacteria bacterium]